MKSKEDNNINSTVNIKNEKPSPESRAEEEASTLYHSCLMLLCFLIFSALIAARIVITMQMSRKTTMQQTEINNLIKENEKVTEENKMMQNKNKELSRERDDLNKTLEIIQTSFSFPVKDYYSNKGCKPCQKNWIPFQEKCYFFFEEPAPWKTWTESRKFCQDKHADLVVIDDLEEQKFVSNHTKFYYDIFHGYWMGLQQTNNTWTWVDGRRDTLGFWTKEAHSKPEARALLIPWRNHTENWERETGGFLCKFICEHEAVICSV
ncbi:C-type lectin domain family 12 member B-like isoform X2 [Xiphophorus hellerii]|uniref:C-type lectin domain family 12 member B-like isoform X2 n=1 Tax=Xiphophorus hellerii TaxID=8084 RepID=UPI0013B3DC8E|nr:C-type lectin domain family 12 member B-like isoform X2 [Xiphophorus hellerii]